MSVLVYRSYRFWLYFAYLVSRRQVYKPIYRGELVGNDLLAQAMFLRESGFYMASSVMLRVYLEMLIKRLTMVSPQWTESPKKCFSDRIGHLLSQNVIDKSMAERLKCVYGELSSVAHGSHVTASRAWKNIKAMQYLRMRLDECFRLALSPELRGAA